MIDYIKIQMKKAHKLGLNNIDRIEDSPKKNKRYRIYFKNNHFIDYGSPNYDNYLIHHDEARRIRFHKRFASNSGYNNPNSPLYFSKLLLW